MTAAKSSDSEPKTASRGGRPRGAMRERILDVALELFTAQGYDNTSLREIAERLGVTKAALYYHFERKDDILLELHLRLHRLGLAALERIDATVRPEDIVAAWPGLMQELIDAVIANQDLFALHQRNRQAFEQIQQDPRHEAEQDDLEQRFVAVMTNDALSLEQRVRMACSVGVVMVGLNIQTLAEGTSAASDIADVADIVRRVVREVVP